MAHAVGLKLKNGAEILIHVGLDTVLDKDKNLVSLVKQGDLVTKGQNLIEFDKDKLEANGYNLSCIVLCTNRSISNLSTNSKVTKKDSLFKC